MFRTFILIALGGAIGSVFRYCTTLMVQKYYSSVFPLATFITNVLGCFLIGLLIGILEKYELTNSDLKWFLIIGFCGGYTTFSAFGFENIFLLQNNNSGMAFAYIGLSLLSGLFAVWFGLFITK